MRFSRTNFSPLTANAPLKPTVARTQLRFSAMAVRERNQYLDMVVELVREHLFENLEDDELCKDICAVVAINLLKTHEDNENSARAWDKKHFHVKADELRRDGAWALPMSQAAQTLAYAGRKFSGDDAERLLGMLPEDLEMPRRRRFKDLELLRGAAAAARRTILKK